MRTHHDATGDGRASARWGGPGRAGWLAALLGALLPLAPAACSGPGDAADGDGPPDPAREAAAVAPEAPAETAAARPEDTEVWEPEPEVVTPGSGSAPPSDAVVLFDGGDLSGWVHEDGSDARWVVEGGALTVAPGTGGIRTRRGFGDVQLHVEWRTPSPATGNGQEPGNSGIFFMERYELQVLDSHGNRTYANGQAGSIYKQHAPLVNASRPPGVWQSYDVVFTAPRFAEDGTLLSPAHMTVFHNGVLIQNHAELAGPTAFVGRPAYEPHEDRAPLMLQDHGQPVSYRNIRVRELEARP